MTPGLHLEPQKRHRKGPVQTRSSAGADRSQPHRRPKLYRRCHAVPSARIVRRFPRALFRALSPDKPSLVGFRIIKNRLIAYVSSKEDFC